MQGFGNVFVALPVLFGAVAAAGLFCAALVMVCLDCKDARSLEVWGGGGLNVRLAFVLPADQEEVVVELCARDDVVADADALAALIVGKWFLTYAAVVFCFSGQSSTGSDGGEWRMTYLCRRGC